MAKFGIGQAVRRVEDQRFLLGQGRYVDDISLPGQCHGVTVLSPHAHARITRVDVAKAKAAPGVLCVLTGADARGGQARQFHRPPDAGGFRRAQGPPHVPAGAQCREGALRRRPRRLRRRRDARAGARCRRARGGGLRAAADDRRSGRSRQGRRAQGVGGLPAGQCRLPADVRQPGRHRCRLREGQARGEAAGREQPPVARHHGAAGRDRRLQRGRRSVHACMRPARTRTARAWRCRISFMSRKTRFGSCRPTSAAVSA